MSGIREHTIYLQQQTEVVAPERQPIAYVLPAKIEEVFFTIEADTKSDDGRSDWVWVTLQNGDLMLATFPEGDTWEELVNGKFKIFKDASGVPQEEDL